MRRIAIAVATSALLSITVLPLTSLASADALVVVFVRHNGLPAPARVTIRDEQGNVQSCEADETGSCQIERVGPGRHLVQVGDAEGAVTRPVMIPEEGKVSLIVPVP